MDGVWLMTANECESPISTPKPASHSKPVRSFPGPRLKISRHNRCQANDRSGELKLQTRGSCQKGNRSASLLSIGKLPACEMSGSQAVSLRHFDPRLIFWYDNPNEARGQHLSCIAQRLNSSSTGIHVCLSLYPSINQNHRIQL